MNYIIYQDGVEINRIVADRDFVGAYCEENGYTWEEGPMPEPAPSTYTETQSLGQQLTDEELARIEMGQQITDLEIMILGGMSNV